MPALYSFNWARSIVLQEKRKYPRATEFVCAMLEISLDNLAAFLAHGDPMWPKLRNAIHLVNSYMEYGPKKADRVTVVKYMRELSYYADDERLAKRLDKLFPREDNERAGIRGGFGGLPAEETLPLFPDLEESQPCST